MNTKTLKALSVAIAFAGGIAASAPAMATLTPVETLGFAGNSVDVWTFVCPLGTVQVRARVYDGVFINNVPALLQVTLGEDGNPTLTATDPTEGGAPSPDIINNVDGAGLYAMAIKKTQNGFDDYRAEAICRNAAGAIFNPVITLRVDL